MSNKAIMVRVTTFYDEETHDVLGRFVEHYNSGSGFDVDGMFASIGEELANDAKLKAAQPEPPQPPP